METDQTIALLGINGHGLVIADLFPAVQADDS